MGRVIDKSTRAHLSAHPRWDEAPRDRSVALRANAERCLARARAGGRRLMRQLLDLLRRQRSLDGMSDEIRAHLDEKVDALIASGMSRPDAVGEARRAFGHVGQIEEAGRDVWRIPVFDDALSDVAFGFRFLRRSPTFAAVAVISLAIGI